MKTLACRDVGGMDCDYVTKGETVEEVKKNALAHAEQVHKDVLQKMTPEDLKQLTERIESVIK